jgi:metallo-beta-lactamase class B
MQRRIHKRGTRILRFLATTAKYVLFLVLGLAAVGAVLLLREQRATRARGRADSRAEPFRIAGNLYYVGENDVTSFLITGPVGHVIIDGGYSASPPLILESIAKLGFDIKDVKVLLNSEPHMDHAGGLSALQQASGAELWASEASADVIANGGDDRDAAVFPWRALAWTGIAGYPPARVDHRVKDGDTIRVGPIVLTAHITGGHTRGCTSWSFTVRDGDRDLDVVSACSLKVMLGTRYPEQAADLERSFRVLRGLPADIWVTSHAQWWGRYRKFVASASAENPTDPFIDPNGYGAYVDTAEAEFRSGRTY